MPTTITGESGVSQVQNGSITQADLTTAVLPLGVGQSWVNQTSIRTFNTDYTNNTGRPIYVSVATYATNTGNSTYALVGSVQVNNLAILSGTISYFSFIVPDGAVYRVVTNNGALSLWAELR